MLARSRPLIAIGYKFNAQKVLSFIFTDNSGSTHAGLSYLSKYPDQFTSVALCPVVTPLAMYWYSSAVNEIDPLNK